MVLKPGAFVPFVFVPFVFFVPCTARAAAAQPATCSGPGAAFGVTSYECQKCGASTKEGRTQFIFHVEPRVLSVEPWSRLQVGDEVISVANRPITTAEGADAFTYPVRAIYSLRVRRGDRQVALFFEVAVDCSLPPSVPAPSQEPPPPPPPAKDAGTADVGRLGFALGCLPSCTQMRSPFGATYWKFDADPPVVAVRPGTPADAAGLKVGDIVVEVDGKSILGAEGYRHLVSSQSKPARTLTLTVLRNGQRQTITITPGR
jgi:C-terminal processing protease CtpA/Prc